MLLARLRLLLSLQQEAVARSSAPEIEIKVEVAVLTGHESKAEVWQAFFDKLRCSPPTGRQSVLPAILLVLFRFGATLGYSGLLVVFTSSAPTLHKISARLSVLMLLQGLVLVGLCPITPAGSTRLTAHESKAEVWQAFAAKLWRLPDPVEWLFSYAPPTWGNISYAQYLLQFIAYALWPRAQLRHWWELLLFFVFLGSIAHLAAHLIIAPLSSRWHRARPAQLLALACLTGAIGAASCAIDQASRDASATSHGLRLPPAYVRIASGAVDVRLNWTSVELDFGEARTLINPSLLWSGGRLLRAARAHATSQSVNYSATHLGQPATEFVTTWHSDAAYDEGSVALGPASAAAWEGWAVEDWGLDGAAPLRKINLHQGSGGAADGGDGAAGDGADGRAWGPLCETRLRWQPSNRTVWRTVVTGPEDPKLTLFPRSFSAGDARAQGEDVVRLTFSSMPRKKTSVDAGRRELVHLSDENQELVYHDDELARMACPTTPHYQMFHTVDEVKPAAGGGYHARAAQLECGASRDEKNWVAFVDGDSLRYVYQLSPHLVVTQDAQGRCLHGEKYLDFSKTAVAQELERLAAVRGMRLHGSGSAVPWGATSRLALFHTKDAEGRYVTLAYTMERTPPFKVINVSRPLPLAGANGAFASSLAIPPGGDKVVVAYGVADAESRAFVMSRAFLLDLFDWSAACDAVDDPPPPAQQPQQRTPEGGPTSTESQQSAWGGLQPDASCMDPTLHSSDVCTRPERSVVVGYALIALLLAALLNALVVCLVAVLRAMASMKHGDEEDAQRSERTSCSPLVGADSTSKPLPRHPPASAFVSPPGGLFGRVAQPSSPASATLPPTRLSHEHETSTRRASFSPSSSKVVTLAQATAREIWKASSTRVIAQTAALRLSGALSLDDMQVRHPPEAAQLRGPALASAARARGALY